jgi:hypothetical protein
MLYKYKLLIITFLLDMGLYCGVQGMWRLCGQFAALVGISLTLQLQLGFISWNLNQSVPKDIDCPTYQDHSSKAKKKCGFLKKIDSRFKF